MGMFVLRTGMNFMTMKHLNGGVYKTLVAPPYSSLPSAAREITSGTKAVRIVTRLIWLYTEKTTQVYNVCLIHCLYIYLTMKYVQSMAIQIWIQYTGRRRGGNLAPIT